MTVTNREICALLGFSLTVAWYLLAPNIYLLNSWSIYENVLLFAIVFIVTSLFLALLGARKEIYPNCRFLIVGAALSCTAGMAFIWTTSGVGRSMLYGLQVTILVILLFSWGQWLCRRPVRRIIAWVAASVLFTSLIYLAGVGVASVLGIAENVDSATSVAIFALSLFPLLSALFFHDDRKNTNDKYDDEITKPQRKLLCKETLKQIAWMQIITLCIGALITGSFDGLTFSPYLDDRDSSSVCYSLLLAIIAFVLLLYIMGKDGTINLNAVSPFFVFSLVAAVCGLTLFVIGSSRIDMLAIAIIRTAYSCFFMLALIIFCVLIREFNLRLSPVFAAALLVAGSMYATSIGILIKRHIGYDFSIIAPIAILCISLLATIYLIQNSNQFFDFRQENVNKATGNNSTSATMDASGHPSIEKLLEQRNREFLADYPLTKRELQILLKVLEGLTDADIAKRTSIKPVTVRWHISNAYKKTGVSSKTELIGKIRGDGS